MRTNGRHTRGIISPVSGKIFAALPLIAGVMLAAIVSLALAVMPAHARTTPVATSTHCTLDGGGIVTAGEIVRTDTGTWACTDDGILVRAITWRHLTHMCHARTLACARVPVAARQDLGLGSRPALLVIGDTSWIYARVGTWGLALYES